MKINKFVLIQIAEESFDEALFIPRLIEQLPANSQVYCLSNSISSAFISSITGLRVSMMTENQENNLHDFSTIVVNDEIDAIIVLDLYKYLVTPKDINFLPNWLDEFYKPIYALDYFNLLEYREHQLLLKANIPRAYAEGEEPEPLTISPILLKPFPPNYPLDLSGEQEKVVPWNAVDSMFQVRKETVKSQIRASFQIDENEKIVTILVDPLLFLKSLEISALGYYMALIEIIGFYLRQFPETRFQFLIVGLFPPQEEMNEIQDLNLKIRYFSHLTADNYLTLIAGSDLLLTHTTRSPLLLDAMVAETPCLVLGNSVIQELLEDQTRELKSFFSPHPFLYDMVHLMMNLNQWTSYLPIFQFTDYPIPYKELDFPEPGMKFQGLIYHFADVFDDLTTVPIFENLLFNPEYMNNFNEQVKLALKRHESFFLSQIIARNAEA